MAIDAIDARFEVYKRGHLQMMVLKAYVGFASAHSDAVLGSHRSIATGAWGCGAFLNNEQVMFVVQALAADLARVSLRYHVPPKSLFSDGHADVTPAIEFLKTAAEQKLTITQALDALASRCEADAAWRTKYKPRNLWGGMQKELGKARHMPAGKAPWPSDAMPDAAAILPVAVVMAAILFGAIAGAWAGFAAGTAAGVAAARAEARRAVAEGVSTKVVAAESKSAELASKLALIEAKLEASDARLPRRRRPARGSSE